jgi:hypothetical protein
LLRSTIGYLAAHGGNGDVKKSRVSTCLALTAFGHLLFASAAHAQTAAPPPPPEAAAPPPGAPPAPSDPSTPAAPAAAPQLREPMTAGPVVRLDSDSRVARLQMMRLRWTDVCTAPCGVAVDPAGVYRIGGGTVRPSIEFRMPRPAGPVLVRAQVGSTVKHWVGIGMIIGGLAGAGSGAFLYSVASGSSTLTSNQRDSDKVIGITYIVIGAIVAAIGIPLAMSSTSVEVQ